MIHCIYFITLRGRNQPHLMIPAQGRKFSRSSRGRGRSSCCPCRGNLQRCRRSPSYRTRQTRLVCRRRPRSSSRECCSWRQDKHSLQPRRSEPPHHWGWRFRQQRGRRTWKPWLDSRAQHNSGGPVLIARVLYQKIWDQIPNMSFWRNQFPFDLNCLHLFQTLQTSNILALHYTAETLAYIICFANKNKQEVSCHLWHDRHSIEYVTHLKLAALILYIKH